MSIADFNPNPQTTDEEYTAFERDLTSLINRHSLENGSNTPDFILAKYLTNQLKAFNQITNLRTAWYAPPVDPDAPRNDPYNLEEPTKTVYDKGMSDPDRIGYEASVQSARRKGALNQGSLVNPVEVGQNLAIGDTGAANFANGNDASD